MANELSDVMKHSAPTRNMTKEEIEQLGYSLEQLQKLKSLDLLPAGIDPNSIPDAQEPVKVSETIIEKKEEPKREMRMLTPDEVAQLGETYEIDPEKETFQKEEERFLQHKYEENNKLYALLDSAEELEDDTFARFNKAVDDDPELKRIVATGNRADLVEYDPNEDFSNDPVATRKEVQEKTVEDKPLNLDDMVPDYDDDENEKANEFKSEEPLRRVVETVTIAENENKITTDKEQDIVESIDTDNTPADETVSDKESNATTVKRPDADTSEEEYAEYIKNLPTIQYEAPEDDPSIVSVKKEKAQLSVVDSGRLGSTKSMQDESFMNAINKYKKDNFRTVTIPLVNSGFAVDIVGSGAVDLTMLYSAADSNISAVDYEMEKMRTVMRNVTGTYPSVPKESMRNMIHYIDYQLMAYAHISATLKTVETIQTCPECGNDYHIECKSSDLLLNMEELRAKMDDIRNSTDINDNSLMLKDNVYKTADGFTVTIGHPSYADYISYITELRKMTEKFNEDSNQVAMFKLNQVAESLHYIRSITIPTGIHTSTLYQKFVALQMLSETDMRAVTKMIKDMSDATIVPRFGIKAVKCPCCGKVNTNIVYETLDDLLFFHIMVTRLLNDIDLTSVNG